MNSINPQVSALHASYCSVMGLDLPMTAYYERKYFDAIQMGLTPEHLELCVKERIRLNHTAGPGFKMKLTLFNLIGSEDDVARVLNEAAVVLASQRIKAMDPARAEVLRQTHRPTAMPQSDAKVVGDLLMELKRAAK